jgi:hypothetical protein
VLRHPVRAACKNAVRLLGERLCELGLDLDQMQGVAERVSKGKAFHKRINIIDATAVSTAVFRDRGCALVEVDRRLARSTMATCFCATVRSTSTRKQPLTDPSLRYRHQRCPRQSMIGHPEISTSTEHREGVARSIRNSKCRAGTEPCPQLGRRRRRATLQFMEVSLEDCSRREFVNCPNSYLKTRFSIASFQPDVGPTGGIGSVADRFRGSLSRVTRIMSLDFLETARVPLEQSKSNWKWRWRCDSAAPSAAARERPFGKPAVVQDVIEVRCSRPAPRHNSRSNSSSRGESVTQQSRYTLPRSTRNVMRPLSMSDTFTRIPRQSGQGF